MEQFDKLLEKLGLETGPKIKCIVCGVEKPWNELKFFKYGEGICRRCWYSDEEMDVN
jgi:hypothetical protein